MSKPLPDVRVGDVWVSCDKRDSCRRLTVESIADGKARVRGVTLTSIRLDRFRPTATGYRLIERDGKPVGAT